MGESAGGLHPHPDVLIQRMPNGETVLLNMETEVYYGLDEVGTRMWEAMTETGNIPEAVQRLSEEFDVDRERLETDFRSLLDELSDAGLMVEEAS